MSAGSILIAVLGAMAGRVPLWAAWLWLARSWEVLDDDQLSEKLSGHPPYSPAVWLRILGWFTRGPRRLTYRRDDRGRFRKIRR